MTDTKMTSETIGAFGVPVDDPEVPNMFLYLAQVQIAFRDKPQNFEAFLAIMKEFQTMS